MVSRTQIVAPPYFHRYIELVREDELKDALKKSTQRFQKFLEKIPHRKVNHAYAEGKWSVKEVLQHVIDAERVFAFRALWFARRDGQPLPGFDENNWAASARLGQRKWKDLLEEFHFVRKSTTWEFDSFQPEQLLAEGIAGGNRINPLALGFICCGHVTHHINIIKERYL